MADLDAGYSSFRFPPSSDLEAIGAGYNPALGQVKSASALADIGDLVEKVSQDHCGEFRSSSRSESYSDMLSYALSASGSGWGATVGAVEEASSLKKSTSTSYTVMLPAFVDQYTQIVDSKRPLTEEAKNAIKNGTFFQDFGSHFVGGYVYGYVCNLSYVYEFFSEEVASSFFDEFDASYGVGFSASFDAKVRGSQSLHQVSISTNCESHILGFDYETPQDLAGLSKVIGDYDRANTTRSNTPTKLIILPWTYLDSVRTALTGGGLDTGSALTALANITNSFSRIKNSCDIYLTRFAGETQYNTILGIKSKASGILDEISAKLSAVAVGKDPLSQADVDLFPRPEPLESELNAAMSKFIVSVSITGDSNLTAACLDMNGDAITSADFAQGVKIAVDWQRNDDQFINKPQAALKIATSTTDDGVFYLIRDSSTGEIYLLVQSQDSGGPQYSGKINARGCTNGKSIEDLVKDLEDNNVETPEEEAQKDAERAYVASVSMKSGGAIMKACVC